MIYGHFKDKPAEQQTKAGTTKTVLRKLISHDEGAKTFSMRVLTIEPAGQIGLHSHPWEHQIFILRGKGTAFTKETKVDIFPDMYVFIPPNEEHGFENTGEESLEFICCIPVKQD